jgi:hypothetical protein
MVDQLPGHVEHIVGFAAPVSELIASVAGRAAGHALSAAVISAIVNALIAQIMFLASVLIVAGLLWYYDVCVGARVGGFPGVESRAAPANV